MATETTVHSWRRMPTWGRAGWFPSFLHTYAPFVSLLWVHLRERRNKSCGRRRWRLFRSQIAYRSAIMDYFFSSHSHSGGHSTTRSSGCDTFLRKRRAVDFCPVFAVNRSTVFVSDRSALIDGDYALRIDEPFDIKTLHIMRKGWNLCRFPCASYCSGVWCQCGFRILWRNNSVV